jgi:hypothetical protein
MPKLYSEEEVKGKIAGGWIHSRLWFEVLSPEKETTEKSMKDHLDRIKKEKGVMVISETFDEAEEVEDPTPQIKKAYSQAVEAELLSQNLEALLYVVIFYGPRDRDQHYAGRDELGRGSHSQVRLPGIRRDNNLDEKVNFSISIYPPAD